MLKFINGDIIFILKNNANNMKKQDKETRYYVDIDVKTKKVLGWDYDQREKIVQNLSDPNKRRIFLTKGQYSKLTK